MITSYTELPGLPAINRCREAHIYTPQGKRYLDLYRESGSMILGHRMKGITGKVKGFLEKGNWGHYPSVWEERVKRHLSGLFPEYGHLKFFASLEYLTGSLAGVKIFDPAIDGKKIDKVKEIQADIGIWRPFLPVPDTAAIIPWIPYSATFFPVILLYREEKFFSKISHSGTVIPFQPSGYSLSAIPSVLGRLSEIRSETYDRLWDSCDHPLWKRRGPYLSYSAAADTYSECYHAFLQKGILLSPRCDVPSVLPVEMSDGERMIFLKECDLHYGRC